MRADVGLGHVEPAGQPSSTAEPPLSALLGRVTYHEFHRVLDRWLLDRRARGASSL